MTEKFIIGIIGSPFGVKGFVKVRSSSGEVDHFLKLQSVVIAKNGKEQEIHIDEISVSAPPLVLIKFKGIDSPEAAKTLSGAQLITSREKASRLDEGEFYIEDLKGLTVQFVNGEAIGHVTDIIEGGGGELLEIKLTVSNDLCLVPFRKEFVVDISLKKGVIVLNNEWSFL